MPQAGQEVKLEFEPAFVPEELIIWPLAKVPVAPAAPFVPFVPVSAKKGIILNIETTGFTPWEHRIIAIGYQDPAKPDDVPSVIMSDNEIMMIQGLFTILKDGGYSQLIGYGIGFDFRFLMMKAMKNDIPCKEFMEMDLYDMMELMAKGKSEYIYMPQRPPNLSDISNYFWNYPKAFTDKEMIAYWTEGRVDKIVEFTSAQITRILALYMLYSRISTQPFTASAYEVGSLSTSMTHPSTMSAESKLTIPEAQSPKMVKLKCPECLGEFEVTREHLMEMCPVCGAKLTQGA